MLRVIRAAREAIPGRIRKKGGLPPVLPARHLLERRQVVLAAAGLAYAGVLALQQRSHDRADAVGLLYVIPIALLALELGLVAGALAALAATVVTVVWWLGVHSSFDLLAILTRTAAFVAVGGIAGWFSDRMRTAQERQRLLLESGLALMRLGDEQRLVGELAEQARRILRAEEVRVDPIGTKPAPLRPDRHERRVVLQAGDVCQGTLMVKRSRPLNADDQTAVSILAWQAAVAAENARLLEVERERAAMRSELRHARLHLDDRAAQLRELIDRLEAERSHVAYELHEQAAQMLAGVLLDLSALDRQLKNRSIDAGLEQLRSDVGSTMSTLRALAVGLKPSALALGLPAALEELVQARDDARSRTVEVTGADDLDPEMSVLVYRAVEEALRAVPEADRIAIRTQVGGSELAIEIAPREGQIEHERLAILRARVELLGGTLESDGQRMFTTLPLRNQATAAIGASPLPAPPVA
ncbi:MAG: histidine kinase [Solirubrobacteraceae bacterium]